MSPWSQLIQEIETFPHEIRNLRVSPHVSPEEIRVQLESHYSFDTPIPLETLTEDAIRLLRTWTVHVTHPRYLASLTQAFAKQASLQMPSWPFITHNSLPGHMHQQRTNWSS